METFEQAQHRAKVWHDGIFYNFGLKAYVRFGSNPMFIYETALKDLLYDFEKDLVEKRDTSEKNFSYLLTMAFKYNWLPEKFDEYLKKNIDLYSSIPKGKDTGGFKAPKNALNLNAEAV